MGGRGSGPRRKKGRPTKLNDEVHREVVKLIEAGNYVDTAAACCNVTAVTLRAWLRRGGRERKGRYRRFLIDVKKAEALAEARALVRIRQAGGKVWQAEAWYLERKFPLKWGRWERVTHDVPQDRNKAREMLGNKDVRRLLDEAAGKLGLASKPGSDS